MKAVVDEAGRMQLPPDVRTQLGVDAGGEVLLEQRAGEWVLKPAHTGSGLAWEGNVLVHRGTTGNGISVEEVIDREREKRISELSQD
jgi:bifunctional DNA-binding transcriptional regulator/antitoxin component of YhaV-PrlF toxin-antitoxin module